MDADYVFAGLVVTSCDQALAWYERFFGRPADMVPHAREAVWRLAETASVYVLADPLHAGNGVVTLVVGDLDGTLAQLAGRGIAPTSLVDVPGAGRKAMFSDPDANTIALAELIGSQ
jgi:predicted enzyme related to lactoylglutathione lyase